MLNGQHSQDDGTTGNIDDDTDNYVVLTKNKFDLQRSIMENLAEEDVKMYGAYNRQPNGYQKLEVLGKGGCAVVWLMQDLKNGNLVAVKQFPKSK